MRWKRRKKDTLVVNHPPTKKHFIERFQKIELTSTKLFSILFYLIFNLYSAKIISSLFSWQWHGSNLYIYVENSMYKENVYVEIFMWNTSLIRMNGPCQYKAANMGSFCFKYVNSLSIEVHSSEIYFHLNPLKFC